MGKTKITKKFATVKRLVNSKDDRMYLFLFVLLRNKFIKIASQKN